MARGNKRKYEGSGRSGEGGGGRGGGAGAGGSSKRPYHRNTSDNAIRTTMAGPGIFITTSRGRERKAALQLKDVLEEHAERLYPDVKLEAYVPVENKAYVKKVLTEEDEDALFNGPAQDDTDVKQEVEEEQAEEVSAATEKPDLPSEVREGDSSVNAPLNDIQAQIQAELAELNATSGGPHSNGAGHGQGTGTKGGPAKLYRFSTVTQGLLDCVAFMRVTAPQDPHALVYSVLEEVERTGGARCRFVQRLTPVADTCAANYESIEALAGRVLPSFFTSDRPRTYRIEPRIRAHNIVTRDPLIQLIGEQVALQAGAHSVDLKNPELVIVVEILKSVCGIGVAEHWNRFRRFNPAMVAEEVNKKRDGGDGGTEGASGSTGTGLRADGAEGDVGRTSRVAGNLGRVAAAQSQQAQEVGTSSAFARPEEEKPSDAADVKPSTEQEQ
ncbi:hypothetical protein CF326_g8462 [Tilletia indica]|nr:hypothetical protein CF326_g8462 [Tilletia indica]